MAESDLLAGVLDLLRVLHYRVAHFRPARTAEGWRTAVAGDGVGWPDIFAVRGPRPGKGPRIVAAELKVGRGKLTTEQAAWLEALAAAGAEVHVWTEADYPDRIIEALR